MGITTGIADQKGPSVRGVVRKQASDPRSQRPRSKPVPSPVLAEASADPRLSGDPGWQLAQRVVASHGFAKSKFLADFLLYICAMHLLEKRELINEQKIGEHVFGRRPGYSSGDDNIVRNYARLLRTRLQVHFSGEGAGETLRLVVPRGGYTPLFFTVDAQIGQEQADEVREDNGKAVGGLSALSADVPLGPAGFTADAAVREETAGKKRANAPRRSWAGWMEGGLCGLVAVAVLIAAGPFRLSIAPPASLFWSTFFNSHTDTLLVPADSGLVLYEDLTEQKVSLAEYVSGNYKQHLASPFGVSAAMVSELGSRRYTSVVDVQAAASLGERPEVVKSRFKIRYAREATLDDLKQSNVILLGSLGANPWVELFQTSLNFQFKFRPHSAQMFIQNLHPRSGEQEIYQTDDQSPAHTTFGVIAAVPGLDGKGYVLMIEGINMAGTDAATDFLLEESSAGLLATAFDRSGRLHPFEILLETSNIGANAAHPRVIATRFSTPAKDRMAR